MKRFEVEIRMYYKAEHPNRNYDVITFSIKVEASSFEEAVNEAEKRLVEEDYVIEFEIV